MSHENCVKTHMRFLMYLTPVKNLMLWFADNKGLATGIAVAGFGLAKAIAGSISVILTVDAVFNAADAA